MKINVKTMIKQWLMECHIAHSYGTFNYIYVQECNIAYFLVNGDCQGVPWSFDSFCEEISIDLHDHLIQTRMLFLAKIFKMKHIICSVLYCLRARFHEQLKRDICLEIAARLHGTIHSYLYMSVIVFNILLILMETIRLI